MPARNYDKEVEEYRNLMEVPSEFNEGFNWTSMVGALFIALLMVPAGMYLQLLAGFGLGPAAQWVTVVLFIEVARRAHKNLKRAEVFVLFYMASAVMAQPFGGLLYNQFFAQSRAATGLGISDTLPIWFAPTDIEVLAQRDFFCWAWMPAIGLIIFQTIMSRINTSLLSYGLFRLASDVEKLPFPMAPVGAQGIIALVEHQAEDSAGGRSAKSGWRWRVFSLGGLMGMAFGAIYLGLPTISAAILGEPIIILPIPFVDWTDKTSEFLPAVATGMCLDIGQFVVGMVLPFWAMFGSFLGWLCRVVANPILYNVGILKSWEVGDDTVKTLFKNNIDFYFSFGIGIACALAIVGFWQIFKSIRSKRAEAKRQQQMRRAVEGASESPATAGIPKSRGDIPGAYVIGAYVLTSMSYILLSGYLIDWHPGVMIVLVFFAFLYTPLISYVTARLEGMAGQTVRIPYVREAAFMLSGYSGGVAVWFLPVPMANYGRRTVFWRQAELTGTRFRSIWKTDLVLVPIVLASAIFFAQVRWSLGPIPGPEYPFAEKMWELNAANQSIIYTATLGRYSAFEEAFRPIYLGAGIGIGLIMFGALGLLAAPSMMAYGMIRGLNQTLPHVVLPQFIGALIGRYYFQKKMGLKWRQYVPVVAAGFFCGQGLVTVFSVGINFLSKAVIKTPF